MADDRPVEDPVEQVGRLQRELDDFKSTVIARLGRRPTGDVEPSIRSTPKANTIVLNGATVSRTTYAGLWAWAQEQGLVIAGLFTGGDGATTFGLPDFRGRVPVGVGSLDGETYALGGLVGDARISLASNQMPSHNHSFSTNTTGAHGEHMGERISVAAGGGSLNLINTQISGGNHSHSGTTASVGGSATVDIRQPSIAVNWLIWT